MFDFSEFKITGLLHQAFSGVDIRKAGELYHQAVGAQLLDDRFGNAELIDTFFNGEYRPVHGSLLVDRRILGEFYLVNQMHPADEVQAEPQPFPTKRVGGDKHP